MMNLILMLWMGTDFKVFIQNAQVLEQIQPAYNNKQQGSYESQP